MAPSENGHTSTAAAPTKSTGAPKGSSTKSALARIPLAVMILAIVAIVIFLAGIGATILRYIDDSANNPKVEKGDVNLAANYEGKGEAR